MKFFGLLLTFILCISVYSQGISYHVSGSVELTYKNYDFPIIFTHNERADLQLIIYKNGDEYTKEGPSRNENDQSFGMSKIRLDSTDTIRIDCYDVDDNNIFTLGLNSDDFICSFNFSANQLINTGSYKDTTKYSRNTLSVYASPYYNANISVISFKQGGSISKDELRMIKKGLLWKPKYKEDFSSTLQKAKKGNIVWKDSYVASVYNNMSIEMTTKTFFNDTWINFYVSVKPGIQDVHTAFGVFTVEITPIE